MASWTDRTPPQFNPYVQQLPVEAMVAVGMEKQKRYDEGVQKIQTNIDNIAGLDIANDADKTYLQSKLNQLGNDLRTVAAGDFSNFQLVNSVSGMTKQIVKDKNIQTAISSTAKLKKEQARKEKAIQDGKSSPENEWLFDTQAFNYLESQEVGQSFNSKYIEYKDVDKKLRGLAADLQKAGFDQSIDNPFKRDNLTGKTLYFNKDGSVSTDPSKGGTPQIDNMMLTTTVKGIGASKILNNFYDSLDEGDKRQLNITAQYHYRDATPITFQNDIIKSYNEKKKLYSEAIIEASVNLATLDLTPEQKTILQKEINKASELVYEGGFDKQMKEDLSKVDTESEADAYKYKIYTQKYLTNLAKDLANESISTKYSDNPGFKALMDQKRLQFDVEKRNQEHQRWLAGHMLNVDKFTYEKYKDAKVDLEKEPIVTAGPLNTDLPKKSLLDVGAEIKVLDENKKSLYTKYGDVIFPKLSNDAKQKALDTLFDNYKLNPQTSLTLNQREYIKERTILEVELSDKNNLYSEAVKIGKSFKYSIPEKGIRITEKDGTSVYFSPEELFDFEHEKAKLRRSAPDRELADIWANQNMKIRVKGTKLEKLYNSTSNPIVSKKLRDIYSKKYVDKIGNLSDKAREAESKFIMDRTPEYQTQVGTINLANEGVVNKLNSLLTLKASQYAERGALDEDKFGNYDPTIMTAMRNGKQTGYQIIKNYDGSATLLVTNGKTVQKAPISQTEMETYFPEYSKRNIVSDIKSAVMASPNKTTNPTGNIDPVNARMTGFSLPGLGGSGLEERVRYDVIGSPFNNGGSNDKFQIILHFNSSKGWISKPVDSSEYLTEQGLSNILNTISPYTISTMLTE
jgi:hypothetical protein